MERGRVVGARTAAGPAQGRRAPLGMGRVPEGDSPADASRTDDLRPADEGAGADDPEVLGVTAHVHEDAVDPGTLGRRRPMPVGCDRPADGPELIDSAAGDGASPEPALDRDPGATIGALGR
jgi:hypothetical protein